MEDLALELGCKVDSLPTSYLGLPLRAQHNSTTVSNGVEERFRKKLAIGKRQHLSKEGRPTLIKKYTIKSFYLYHVPIPNDKNCQNHAGESFKGFFVGRRQFGEHNSSGELGCCLLQ